MSEEWDFDLLPGETPELNAEFIAACMQDNGAKLSDKDTGTGLSHEYARQMARVPKHLH